MKEKKETTVKLTSHEKAEIGTHLAATIGLFIAGLIVLFILKLFSDYPQGYLQTGIVLIVLFIASREFGKRAAKDSNRIELTRFFFQKMQTEALTEKKRQMSEKKTKIIGLEKELSQHKRASIHVISTEVIMSGDDDNHVILAVSFEGYDTKYMRGRKFPKVFVNGQGAKAEFLPAEGLVSVKIPNVISGKVPERILVSFGNEDQLSFGNPLFLTQEILDHSEISWQCNGERNCRKIVLNIPGPHLIENTYFDFDLLFSGRKRGTFKGSVTGPQQITIPLMGKVSGDDRGKDAAIRLHHAGIKIGLPKPLELAKAS